MNLFKKMIGFVCLSIMIFFLAECKSGISGTNTMGIFYQDVTHSESRDTVIGLKPGVTCQTSFLSLVAFGDNSIPQAAMNGNIRIVDNVAFRNQGILFGILWAKNCTIVYGR